MINANGHVSATFKPSSFPPRTPENISRYKCTGSYNWDSVEAIVED